MRTSLPTVILLSSLASVLGFVTPSSLSLSVTPSRLFILAPRMSTRRHASNNSDEQPPPLEIQEEDAAATKLKQDKAANKAEASKRKMLKFALPALGIYLCNPLLSNIDNAFVGRTVGTVGLAALSPATICTDQALYLFSFLARATTGLVSRAYGTQEDDVGKRDAARKAASPPLTVALMCGFVLSLLYALFTPKLLSVLNVDPALRGKAASYIYWRGAIAWAALAQSVALSVMMATRDVMTPLKIIGLAAAVNIVGDAALCIWPLQLGVSGAAAATAFATLFSSGFMLKALKKKNILPKIKLPTKKEMMGLMEFTGPLLAITVTRLVGLINMQRAAMKLGVASTAAYQLTINLVLFFLLFGEPLSQLSQTQLPSLVDSQDSDRVRSTLKSVLVLGAAGALSVGAVAASILWFGTGLFSSDLAVQALAKGATPAVFITVVTAIFTVTVDGAMLASRDFTYMLIQGLSTMFLQIKLLDSYTNSISDIYATYTIRLGSYAIISLLRVALGKGPLGRAIRKGKNNAIPAINGINGAEPNV